MGIHDDIQRELRAFVKSRVGSAIMPAKVVSIDEDARTAEVIDVDGNTIYDVRLRAAATSGDGLFLVPAVGSWVLIGRLGDSENWAILMYSELTRWEMMIDETNLEFAADGVKIARSSESLKAVLDDLLDAIKLITVNTPSGVSGVPNNSATFTTLATRLGAILK